MKEIDELLTRKEATKQYSLPDGMLEDLARRKKAPAYFRFTTRTVLYSRAELTRWVDAARIAGSR